MSKKILVCAMLGFGLLAGCGDRRAGDSAFREESISTSVSQIETENVTDMSRTQEQLPDKSQEEGNVYVGTIYNTGPFVIKAPNSLDESTQLLIRKAGEEAEGEFRKGINSQS